MNLTIRELLNSKPVFEKLSQKSMPAKTAYRISKILKILNREFKDFDSMRKSLIQKFGERKDDNSDDWRVKEENVKEFTDEMNSIIEEEIILEGVMKFKLSDLESLELTPVEIYMIDSWIEDPDSLF